MAETNEINSNNEMRFLHLCILIFLTIGTRNIIERNFSIIESLGLQGVKYVLVDIIYFTIIAAVYYLIYCLIINLRK